MNKIKVCRNCFKVFNTLLESLAQKINKKFLIDLSKNKQRKSHFKNEENNLLT